MKSANYKNKIQIVGMKDTKNPPVKLGRKVSSSKSVLFSERQKPKGTRESSKESATDDDMPPPSSSNKNFIKSDNYRMIISYRDRPEQEEETKYAKAMTLDYEIDEFDLEDITLDPYKERSYEEFANKRFFQYET